jgi:hypothetical protein
VQVKVTPWYVYASTEGGGGVAAAEI